MDAALRSGKPNAQLVAAEVLWRNSEHLDPCQSTYWPSYIDGSWDPGFGPKTKLLLIDALVRTTKAKNPANENAVRSVAVRLYGIFNGERNPHVRSCVATLIKALIPFLELLQYTDFMQGNMTVTLNHLKSAAAHAESNLDHFLALMTKARAETLHEWAKLCPKGAIEHENSPLATATTNPTPE